MAGRVALIANACLIMSACSSLCNNVVPAKIPSPDERFVAYVFARDCGATTSSSVQVSIITRGDLLRNLAGNVLVTSEVPSMARNLRAR